MAKIAWRPPETVATAGLVSVIIEPGKVTERMWLEALPDRTVEMALQEPYPMAAAEQACRVLGLALTERPYELGAGVAEHFDMGGIPAPGDSHRERSLSSGSHRVNRSGLVGGHGSSHGTWIRAGLKTAASWPMVPANFENQ